MVLIFEMLRSFPKNRSFLRHHLMILKHTNISFSLCFFSCFLAGFWLLYSGHGPFWGLLFSGWNWPQFYISYSYRTCSVHQITDKWIPPSLVFQNPRVIACEVAFKHPRKLPHPRYLFLWKPLWERFWGFECSSRDDSMETSTLDSQYRTLRSP